MAEGRQDFLTFSWISISYERCLPRKEHPYLWRPKDMQRNLMSGPCCFPQFLAPNLHPFLSYQVFLQLSLPSTSLAQKTLRFFYFFRSHFLMKSSVSHKTHAYFSFTNLFCVVKTPGKNLEGGRKKTFLSLRRCYCYLYRWQPKYSFHHIQNQEKSMVLWYIHISRWLFWVCWNLRLACFKFLGEIGT